LSLFDCASLDSFSERVKGIYEEKRVQERGGERAKL